MRATLPKARRAFFCLHHDPLGSLTRSHTYLTMIARLKVNTNGRGLYEITAKVEAVLSESGVVEGLCTLFIRHTSASLLIQENADRTARHDLEQWLTRLVPEGDPHFTHTLEGDDDMPAHIKAALTPVSLGVPVTASRLALGTWQGIYVWEHRRTAHTREVVVHIAGA